MGKEMPSKITESLNRIKRDQRKNGRLTKRDYKVLMTSIASIPLRLYVLSYCYEQVENASAPKDFKERVAEIKTVIDSIQKTGKAPDPSIFDMDEFFGKGPESQMNERVK